MGVLAVAGLLQLCGSVSSPVAGPRPDLPANGFVAVAHNGVQGYCCWGELQGPPNDILPTRLVRFTCDRGYGIPIYEADGITRIGTFELGGPGSGGGGSSTTGVSAGRLPTGTARSSTRGSGRPDWSPSSGRSSAA